MPPPPARPTDPDPAPRASVGAWIRRLGVAGFLFFLVKGLLWLLVPALLVRYGAQCAWP